MLCCFCTHMDVDTMCNGEGYCDIEGCNVPFTKDPCGFYHDYRPVVFHIED